MPTRDEVRTHAAIHMLAEQARKQTQIADRAQKVAEYEALGRIIHADGSYGGGPRQARLRELAAELWPAS